MAQDPIKPQATRRWLRYSLRTLLILVTLACVGFAWFGYRLRQASQQAAAVKRVEELGGSVIYDYLYDYEWVHRLDPPFKVEFDSAQRKFVTTQRPPAPEPPGPEWLRERLGIDFFARVEVVDLQDSTNANPEDLIHDADLAILTSLTKLRVVSLNCGEITNAGLAQLANLPRMERLALSTSKISDAGLMHLRGLAQLEYLQLRDAQIGDAGVAHLQGLKHLKTLDLSGTKITDAALSQLEKLSELQELKLGYTTVSYPGLSDFLDKRPLVKVTWPQSAPSPTAPAE